MCILCSSPAGAKPLLKCGDKFPCLTLHYLPALQPVQTLAGAAAVDQLAALLQQELQEREVRGGAAVAQQQRRQQQESAATAPLPSAAAAGEQGQLVVLRRGAVDPALRHTQRQGRPLAIG